MLPKALVLHANGLFVEDPSIEVNEFTILLWPGALLLFRRTPLNRACFEAVEVLSASCRDQHQQGEAHGVLWSRQAAP